MGLADLDGCKDSLMISVEIIGQPELADLDPVGGCENYDLSELTLVETTGLDISDAIITYYNDGGGTAGAIITDDPPVVSNSGTYWLVLDYNTCTDEVPVEVTIEEPIHPGTPEPPVTVCNDYGTTINLNNLLPDKPDGGYWEECSLIPSFNGFFSDLGIFAPFAQFPGEYNFCYIIPHTYCDDAIATVQVFINEPPSLQYTENATVVIRISTSERLSILQT